MADFQVLIFEAGNFQNPQAPGTLPIEDSTFLSSLTIGDTLTYLGGGETTLVTITDNVNTTFDEAQSNQFLASPVTFDGVTYSAGQTVTPTYTLVMTGDDGNTYTLTSFNFAPNTNGQEPDAIFFEGAIPPPGTQLTLIQEINPTGSQSRNYSNFAICFAKGAQIATPDGKVAVEQLQVGDAVLTLDGPALPVKWVGLRHINRLELARSPQLRPIQIAKGALGPNMPSSPLKVSRQHRICIRSKIAERMFGRDTALVAAHHLLGVAGVSEVLDDAPLTYVHILLEGHAAVAVNGAYAESLLMGPMAVALLSDTQSDGRITPPLPPMLTQTDMAPAFPIPRGSQQRQLVQRHIKNGKPLFASAVDAGTSELAV